MVRLGGVLEWGGRVGKGWKRGRLEGKPFSHFLKSKKFFFPALNFEAYGPLSVLALMKKGETPSRGPYRDRKVFRVSV